MRRIRWQCCCCFMQLADSIRVTDDHFPITRLVCIENTHNGCGGRSLDFVMARCHGSLPWLAAMLTIPTAYVPSASFRPCRPLPLTYLEKLWQLAQDRDLKVHVDGARLWNAAVGLGVPPAKLVCCMQQLNHTHRWVCRCFSELCWLEQRLVFFVFADLRLAPSCSVAGLAVSFWSGLGVCHCSRFCE